MINRRNELRFKRTSRSSLGDTATKGIFRKSTLGSSDTQPPPLSSHNHKMGKGVLGGFLESMYSQNGDWVHACVLNTEASVFSSLDPYPHEGDSGPSLVHLTCLGAPPVSSRAMRAEFTSVLQRLPLRCEGNLPTCVKNRDRVLQKRLRESKSREENQKYCHW